MFEQNIDVITCERLIGERYWCHDMILSTWNPNIWTTHNKSNAVLELWNLCHQNPSLFNSGSPKLINNEKIDAKCDKYAIIIYCTLTPISHENIVFSPIIKFYVQDQIK